MGESDSSRGARSGPNDQRQFSLQMKLEGTFIPDVHSRLSLSLPLSYTGKLTSAARGPLFWE